VTGVRFTAQKKPKKLEKKALKSQESRKAGKPESSKKNQKQDIKKNSFEPLFQSHSAANSVLFPP
jgi:hypothetical protein